MSKIYFGGSRHSCNINHALVAQVVSAVAASNQIIHVGCQLGADQSVVYACSGRPSSLVVFAVAPASSLPWHVRVVAGSGARVVPSAGGSVAPMPARFLLRSIAAFQGCSQAVFFSPGSGSLAVAAHAVQAGIPVYSFSSSAPASPVGCAGSWVQSSFMGFACWQWSPAQIALF